jgi:glucose/arabinose dehydrogenase
MINYHPTKGRINVKKIAVVLAVLALAAAGCQKKEEAVKPAAQQAGAPQMPGAAPGGDPHAGLKPMEIPAGAGHKGKVLQTMDAGSYTYVEVEEKGQKLWIAVMKEALVKEGVKVGDTIEFPDSPPMVNFQSKELKKTFDKVIFSAGLRKAK